MKKRESIDSKACNNEFAELRKQEEDWMLSMCVNMLVMIQEKVRRTVFKMQIPCQIKGKSLCVNWYIARNESA